MLPVPPVAADDPPVPLVPPAADEFTQRPLAEHSWPEPQEGTDGVQSC
jgi:hypothetical protein